MYLFLMITGYIFVVGLSIILNYLFELFPINKITKFLSPLEDTIFNNIGMVIIPNLLWALIEVVMLGTNRLFLLGIMLNIFISLCVMYVIKYGYFIISNTQNSVVSVVAIFFSCFFGFACNYICLLIGINRHEINILYSIIGLLIFIIFYLLIRLFPPKSDFFQGNIK